MASFGKSLHHKFVRIKTFMKILLNFNSQALGPSIHLPPNFQLRCVFNSISHNPSSYGGTLTLLISSSKIKLTIQADLCG